MAQRSLNKVQLTGNLTRDPELRYTPQGTAVCTFGLATNRSWVTEAKEKKEEAEFHRIVAWNKLAELCSQLLFKGRRVYVEGRLQTRSWTASDGTQRQTTEVVISDMIILDSRRTLEDGAITEEAVAPEGMAEGIGPEEEGSSPVVNNGEPVPVSAPAPAADDKQIKPLKKKEEKKKPKDGEEEIDTNDIPF